MRNDSVNVRSDDGAPQVVIEGFSYALGKTAFAGTFAGNLSALALDVDGRIVALSDRSALILLDAGTWLPIGVIDLFDESGEPFVPEGVVVDDDGTFLISSDEPAIRRFSRDGKAIGTLPIPDELCLAPVGRATINQTFEGLALQHDGRTLIASTEGPLTGDDTGTVRFQTWRRVGGSHEFEIAAQYGYPIDHGLAVSDVCDTGDGRLITVERGSDDEGDIVRLYLADPHRAADVSDVPYLTGRGDVRLVAKTLLVDVVDLPSAGATSRRPQPSLTGIEGVTIVGRTPDGRVRLLLVSDDNHCPHQTTRLYSLTARLPRCR
jgi:hypothetical protein